MNPTLTRVGKAVESLRTPGTFSFPMHFNVPFVKSDKIRRAYGRKNDLGITEWDRISPEQAQLYVGKEVPAIRYLRCEHIHPFEVEGTMYDRATMLAWSDEDAPTTLKRLGLGFTSETIAYDLQGTIEWESDSSHAPAERQQATSKGKNIAQDEPKAKAGKKTAKAEPQEQD